MKFRVWWIPQVPMDWFNFEVASLAEGKLLLDALAEYDKFQFANRIKPDYSNAGGLQFRDEMEGEWVDWTPDERQAEVLDSIHPGIWIQSIDDLTLDEVRDMDRKLALSGA